MSITANTGSRNITVTTTEAKIFTGACRRIAIRCRGTSANEARIRVVGMHKADQEATIPPGFIEYFEAGSINNDITEVFAKGEGGDTIIDWYIVGTV